jgi:hypothetical protein
MLEQFGFMASRESVGNVRLGSKAQECDLGNAQIWLQYTWANIIVNFVFKVQDLASLS